MCLSSWRPNGARPNGGSPNATAAQWAEEHCAPALHCTVSSAHSERGCKWAASARVIAVRAFGRDAPARTSDCAAGELCAFNQHCEPERAHAPLDEAVAHAAPHAAPHAALTRPLRALPAHQRRRAVGRVRLSVSGRGARTGAPRLERAAVGGGAHACAKGRPLGPPEWRAGRAAGKAAVAKWSQPSRDERLLGQDGRVQGDRERESSAGANWSA